MTQLRSKMDADPKHELLWVGKTGPDYKMSREVKRMLTFNRMRKYSRSPSVRAHYAPNFRRAFIEADAAHQDWQKRRQTIKMDNRDAGGTE